MVVSEKWGMVYYPESGRLEWTHTGEEAGGVHKGKGYRRFRSRKDKRQYAVHRVIFDIMGVDAEGYQVDHINGIRDDNRWCNLRLVTPYENRMNTRIRGNITGYKNVYQQSNRTWIARLVIRGIRYQTSHSSPEEADKAARDLRENLQGDFSCDR